MPASSSFPSDFYVLSSLVCDTNRALAVPSINASTDDENKIMFGVSLNTVVL